MIAWLIETTFAVTLLMLLVLAVRRPVAHFFGASWAYALWLLPALRLVLPPLNLFGAEVPTLLPQFGEAAPAAAVPTAFIAAEVAAPAFDWQPVLLGLWLTGTALFILWQSYSYLAFVRRLGIGSQVKASLAQDIGIVESPEVDGPLAIGLLDRWIVVPADFSSRYSPEEQRLALQHERIHHQREDIFCNMVALGVLALNWFNPVAYIAFRAFRADQELSCDAAVAALASGTERHDYASALVKSASKPGLIAACPLNHAGQLKQRLRMMKRHRRSGLRALGGASAVAALLLAGVTFTESAGVAAPEPAPAPPPAPAPAPAPAAAPKPRIAAAPLPRAAAPARPKAPKAEAPKPAPAAAPQPAAAPAPPPAASPAPGVAPTPPAPRAVVVHLKKGPTFFRVDRAAAEAGELRLIRTHVRTVQVSPEVEARLKALLADRDRLRGEARTIILPVHQQEN